MRSAPLFKAQTDSTLGVAAGSHMRRPSNGEHSGSVQVGGRPLETWELEDDAAGGAENMHHSSSTTFQDWIRAQPDRNFDPDLVPDASVADYLGGTVSLSANRAGAKRVVGWGGGCKCRGGVESIPISSVSGSLGPRGVRRCCCQGA